MGEWQETINRPDEGHHKVQQLDLPESEGFFFQYPSVKPPTWRADTIELQHFFDAKASALAGVQQLFLSITPVMSQHAIKGPEKLRPVGDQNNGAAILVQTLADIAQRLHVPFQMLYNVQAHDGVESFRWKSFG